MKKVLIILKSAIVRTDVSILVKNKGHFPILKKEIQECENYLKEFDPDILITEINSELVDVLEKACVSCDKPILFLNDSLKTNFNFNLIKSKWDLIAVPIDNKEFEEKLTTLLKIN